MTNTVLRVTEGFVRFNVEGWHYWPDAPKERAYLGKLHRHIFYVEVSIQLFRNDREIEFHDFLDFCKSNFPSGDLGARSCETLASDLLDCITSEFPGRDCVVTVSEDNENGATVLIQNLEP